MTNNQWLRSVRIDSFSGAAADLPKARRSPDDVLCVLTSHPRVSTWDMRDCLWLRCIIEDLCRKKLIERADEPYPWCRFVVTAKGLALIADSKL